MLVSGEGTNVQHSFFQLIHQGPDKIPVEFIKVAQVPFKSTLEQTAFEKLNANLTAQIRALAEGDLTEDLNKEFSGKRPSTLLTLQFLSPSSIGQLIAFYENRTMFEGFIWDINSFDQEGVQLGKMLTKEIF